MPSSLTWTYLPLKGGSVPACRKILYCSGESCSRHSCSDLRSSVIDPIPPLAADLGHSARGLDEVGLVDAVAPLLAGDRVEVALRDRVVGRAGAQRCAKVVFGGGEQAGSDLAVRGHADAVALGAEGARDRGDDA